MTALLKACWDLSYIVMGELALAQTWVKEKSLISANNSEPVGVCMMSWCSYPSGVCLYSQSLYDSQSEKKVVPNMHHSPYYILWFQWRLIRYLFLLRCRSWFFVLVPCRSQWSNQWDSPWLYVPSHCGTCWRSLSPYWACTPSLVHSDAEPLTVSPCLFLYLLPFSLS